MCHTGRPLGRPCKHCSVTALITKGKKERGIQEEGWKQGEGGGCDNKGEGGMKTRGQRRTQKKEKGEGNAKWREHDSRDG